MITSYVAESLSALDKKCQDMSRKFNATRKTRFRVANNEVAEACGVPRRMGRNSPLLTTTLRGMIKMLYTSSHKTLDKELPHFFHLSSGRTGVAKHVNQSRACRHGHKHPMLGSRSNL